MRRRGHPGRRRFASLDRAGFKIIATGLRQCLLDADASPQQAAAERAELQRLFMALA